MLGARSRWLVWWLLQVADRLWCAMRAVRVVCDVGVGRTMHAVHAVECEHAGADRATMCGGTRPSQPGEACDA